MQNNAVDKHFYHRADIRPGRGPHAAQLYCLECNIHIKWLTKEELTASTKPLKYISKNIQNLP